MKFNIILLLSIAILGTIAAAISEDKTIPAIPGFKLLTTEPPADEIEKHHNTTTEKPTTLSSTEGTTTTTTTTTEGKTTTTTTEGTTTTSTAAPTTTTAAPNTTEAPETTTAHVITTTAGPPVPTPDPAIGKWNLTDGGNICIILNAAIQLKVTYVTKDNITKTVLHNVPAELADVAPGKCGNDTDDQEILVRWGPASSQSSFLMLFSLNSTTHEYSLKEYTIALNANELPNGKNETLTLWYTANFFSVPKGMSYHCTKNQTLNLTDEEKSNKTIAWAFVSHLQVEAYHKGNKAQFSYAKDCDAIDTPDIVPIAVGCALIALVIVVLIAYLVGRRRAQARGYISM